MFENIGYKTLLWRVLIQLWNKWPKCFSAQNDWNVSAKKKQLWGYMYPVWEPLVYTNGWQTGGLRGACRHVLCGTSIWI